MTTETDKIIDYTDFDIALEDLQNTYPHQFTDFLRGVKEKARQQALSENEEEITLIFSNFNKTLVFATNGRMSKPNYTWEAIKEQLLEAQEERDKMVEKATAESIFRDLDIWIHDNYLYCPKELEGLKEKYLGQETDIAPNQTYDSVSRPDARKGCGKKFWNDELEHELFCDEYHLCPECSGEKK